MVPRDREKVRRRLQEAALELFRDRGYASVTAASIAHAAGVTERTFFRHFADKREVLFDGEAALTDLLVTAVRQAPASFGAWQVLRLAFHAAGPLLTGHRALGRARRRVIDDNPSLQERELAKGRALAVTLATTLRERGSPERTAFLLASTGMAVLTQAFALWLHDDAEVFPACLDQAFHDLHDLTADR